MNISDKILDMMRLIDFDNEIKFAPEGTTEADLFGVYDAEEFDVDEDESDHCERYRGAAKEVEIPNLDDLY